MISIEYDKGKMRSIISGLKGFSKAGIQQMKVVVTASILDIQTAAAVNAPHKKGILRKGITHDIESSANEVVGLVGSNIAYARIQEMGGDTGRNKSVHIRPKRYLARAIESNKGKIAERFRKLKIVQG